MAYGTRRFNAAFKGSPIIPILSRINPIIRIDTYLFKVHSNIVLPSTPRPPHADTADDAMQLVKALHVLFAI